MAEHIDYSQVFDFLYRIDRRIGLLEKDASYIEKQIIHLDSKKQKTFIILDSELKELHKNLSDLKSNLGKCSHAMASLGNDMKNAVKIDDIQSLNNAVDELQFEDYVTKKDLARGL